MKMKQTLNNALTFVTLCIVLFAACAEAFSFRSLKEMKHKQQQSSTVATPFSAEPKEQYFTQKLDHFDRQETRTWKQRYFMNDTFWNPDDAGPIFFQVGGEGAISSEYVTSLEMAHYAQHFGALMVALEHRFYGKSKPLSNLTTPNLRFLSSQQALADAAYFLESFKKTVGCKTCPIITFGCSYPGALAAWFRIKYPTVTLGSVASSAPVQATLDFLQYLDVVEQSISYFTGKVCDNLIRNATSEIQQMLQSDSGKKKVEEMFNVCQPLNTSLDIATFMSSLMGNWMGTVQYNDENGNPITVKSLCQMMVNTSKTKSPLQAYVEISNLFLNASEDSCLDASYNHSLTDVLNTTQNEESVGIRSWTYQTCAEFAYFQTTDSPSQPFGNLVPLSLYTDMCTAAFGPMNTSAFVNETNMLYGGRDLQPSDATNIVFVNGNIDPWHALGVTKNISSALQAVFIDGTAHCANVLPTLPTDTSALKIARMKVQKHISQWLGLTD